jgi:methionyl-tRNA formyltransferase
MVKRLRAAFLGTPAFAVPTLDKLLTSDHNVCVVLTQPDRQKGRGRRIQPSPIKVLAQSHGIPVFQPESLNELELFETLQDLRLDIGIVAAYGKLIPQSLIDVPRLGMVNVHASLLPLYRGASPVHRAVIDGATETGVCIMRVERTLDTGGVLARVTRPISLTETSLDVEQGLSIMGATLLVKVLDQLSVGTVNESPQDEQLATYAPRLTKRDGLVDWSLSAKSIHNLVRGLHPWPHAYSFLNGTRLAILRTKPAATVDNLEPGTVLQASKETLTVATGYLGCLAIELLQADGGRPLTAREYLAGHLVQAGARFSDG